MFDKEKLIEFLKKQGVHDGQDTSWLKNLYIVFSMITEERYFDIFIKGKIYEVRNPYKSVYPIKVDKDLMKNIGRRIEGDIKIKQTNLVSRQDCCNAVVLVSIIFHKMGYDFSEKELARINECYRISQKLSNNKLLKYQLDGVLDGVIDEIQTLLAGESYSKEECSEYRQSFEDALTILKDNNKTLQYIHDCLQNNKENQEKKAIYDILSLVCCSKVNFNETVNVNCSKIQYMFEIIDKGITSYDELEEEYEIEKSYGKISFDEKKRAEYDVIIDEIVKKSMSESEKGEDLAYCLYKNLNDAVVYNTIAFSWSQDNAYIQSIIGNDKSEDINLNRNEVTCHTWSRAMMDLLTKTGYEAYIVGRRYHQFVLFFDENYNVYIADATNAGLSDRPNWFKGSDLSRTKMALTPTNFFQVLGHNEYLQPDDVLYVNGTYKRESDIAEEQYKRQSSISFNIDEFKDENGQYDYTAIFKYMDDNPRIVDSIMAKMKERHDGGNIVDFITEVVKWITKGHEDDDALLASCLSNLIYVLTKGERNMLKEVINNLNVIPLYSIGHSHDLYRQTETRTEFVQLIYIKGENEKEYFVWDKEKGFVKTSKQEIIDKINSGEYHSSTNNGSRGKLNLGYVIPGIRSPRKTIQSEENSIFDIDNSSDWQVL